MSLIVSGCVHTEGSLKISGNVIDEHTSVPVPGRAVIVKGLVESNSTLISVDAGQFYTDSSGYFSFAMKKVKDAFYYNFCIVGDSDYACLTRKMALIPLQRNAKELSFPLNKLADLTIRISRITRSPLYDTLILSWKSDGIDGRAIYPYRINNYGLTTSQDLIWTGGPVRSIVKTRAFAEKKTVIRWVLYRNGKMKEITDTLTCKRDLINEVTLKY